jgi:toxin-antitoxin system PIN domain toxin
VGIAWVVLLGFLRLATHPRISPRPLDAAQAIDRVDAWLAHPNVRIVTETGEQWRLLKSQLDATGTAGNLPTDAHLASLAIAHGATLVSCDTDFGRFAKLPWVNPLSA